MGYWEVVLTIGLVLCIGIPLKVEKDKKNVLKNPQ